MPFGQTVGRPRLEITSITKVIGGEADVVGLLFKNYPNRLTGVLGNEVISSMGLESREARIIARKDCRRGWIMAAM